MTWLMSQDQQQEPVVGSLNISVILNLYFSYCTSGSGGESDEEKSVKRE